MKISELAKELGKENKVVLDKANELGIEAKSATKSITDEEAKKIKGAFVDKPKAVKAAPGMPNIPFGAGPNPPMGKVVISKDIEARTIDKHGNIIKSKEELDKKADKVQEKAKETAEKVADDVKKATKEAKENVKKVGEKVQKEAKKIKKDVDESVEKIENKTEEIGIKIIKKAEDVRKEEMSKAAEVRAKRAEQRKEREQKKKESSKPGEKKKQLKSRKFDTDSRKQDDRKQSKKTESSRRFENNDMQPMETKRGGRGRKNKDKDKDKYDRFDDFGGKKSKKAMKQRSLEKAAKPKKHKDYKQQVEEPEEEEEIIPEGTKVIMVPITVAGFCEQTEVSTSRVIMELMKLGIMANINQNLDEDTCELLGAELGLELIINKAEEKIVEEGIEDFEDRESDLEHRPPIITVMGHVDHGKTSLLDAIRNTNVIEGESGGITQHIGASEVEINGKKIVFLDTPGHEAFTAMRARGAMVTDIAVLVVAADDSVKPQTIESISHAKAAGVPIIVAVNKIDKPGANVDKVKQDLSEHGILVEDWGGDVICVPVSAKKNEGIVQLLEMILLQAEVLELKANPNRLAQGTVIEARLDKSKGPVASLLVTKGTLKAGSSIVVGTCSGRIRLMTNHKGETIRKAGPATPVEVLGLNDVPQAGDEFNAVKQDKIAKEIAENRKNKLREEVLAKNSSTSLDQLFGQIKEGEVKDLNLIIKGDVQGSVGAIVSSLEKLNNENVKVNVVHTGVGTVNESDVTLASTTGAIIIGFNVRPTTAVQTMADRENIEIRLYRVIYDIINDVEDAMKGMLEPEFKEEVLGKAEVRDTFKVPSVGVIAGAFVTEGKVVRNAEIRLVRDGIVVHEGNISSLKRFKDDAKEVAKDFECGIGIENYNDIKEGDVIECFHMVEIEKE